MTATSSALLASDHETPPGQRLPGPHDLPEPRTPPLGDPDEELPGDVPEEPEDPTIELPDDEGAIVPDEDAWEEAPDSDSLPGRQDRETR